MKARKPKTPKPPPGWPFPVWNGKPVPPLKPPPVDLSKYPTATF